MWTVKTPFLRVCKSVKNLLSCMSFRLTDCTHGTTGSNLTDFHEIWYLRIFRKSSEKHQVSLKSERNNGTLHQRLCTFTISRKILLIMGNVSDESCRKNQNTHFTWNTFIYYFFFFENPTVYEIMWKNIRARNATDDNIIWSMRFACRITKAIIQT